MEITKSRIEFPLIQNANVSETTKAENVVKESDKIQDNVNKALWVDTRGTDTREWSIGDKWKATSDTWDDTWAAKLYDYAKYDAEAFQTTDTNFKASWTDEAIKTHLNIASLPYSYYQKLSSAQNKEHKDSLYQWAIMDNQRINFINKSLNQYGDGLTERMSASLATGLVDVDAPISLGFGVLAKVAKAKKIMMAGAVGTHATVAATIYGIDGGETSAGEALAFGLLGMAGDAYAIHRLSKKADDIASTTIPDIPSNENLVNHVQLKADLAARKATREAEIKKEKYDDTLNKKDLKSLEKLNKDIEALPEGVKKRKLISERDRLKIKTDEFALAKQAKEAKPFDILQSKERLIKEELELEDISKRISAEETRLLEIETRMKPIKDRISELKQKKQEPKVTRQKEKDIKTQERYEQELKMEADELAKEEAVLVELKKQARRDKINKLVKDKEEAITSNQQRRAEEKVVEKQEVRKRQTARERLEESRLADEDVSIAKKEEQIANQKKKIDDMKDAKKASEARKAIEAEELKVKQRKEQLNKDRLRNEARAKESMVVESNIKTMYKKIEEIIKKSEADNVAARRNESMWRVKRLVGIQKTLDEMGQDLVQNVAEWRAHINKAISEKNMSVIEDMKNVLDEVFKKGYIDKGTYQNLTNTIKGNKSSINKIKGVLNKDGNFEISKGNGKKLVIGGALGLVLASNLSADDGSISFDNPAVILAMAIGAGLIAKNFKAISGSVASAANKIRTIDRTRPLMDKLDTAISKIRTQATETFAPLSKDGSKEFTDFMKKVLWDAESGESLTVERNKAAIYHGFSARLHSMLDLNYNDYVKSVGMNKASAAFRNLSITEISVRLEFEKKVMEFIENGKYSDVESVVKSGNEIKAMHKEIKQMMIDSGVDGADKMLNLGDSYMTRYVRSNELRDLLLSISEQDYKKFVTKFAATMKGDYIKAEAYLQAAITHTQSNRTITKLTEVEEFLKANNIVGVSADEVADLFGIPQSKLSRTKARIAIDKSMFEDFTVTYNGSEKKIGLNEIFVNNAVENMDRYLNQVSGHIAFADADFKSLDKAFELAGKAHKIENIKVMEDVINHIIGVPNAGMSIQTAKMLQVASNLTVAAKMPFSVISLAQETFNTIVKSRGGAFKTFTEEFKNIVLKHGKSSALVEELVDFLGQGNHRVSASYGSYSHISNGVDNMSTSTGALTKASEIARDTVLYNLGLVPVSDVLTRINLVDSASYLHDIAHGVNTMPSYMKNIIGLTPDIEDMLKGKLTKVDGNLQSMNIKDWSRTDQLAFRKVVDNMMMKRIQMATIGGTPHWGRADALGIYMSGLLKFPLQAFSNHGIVDLKGVLIHKDPRAMMSMMAWFGGGYLAAMLRYEIKGQDYDDDDLIVSAMLSMPLVGGAQAIYSLASNGSAMQNAMSDFSMGMIDVGKSIISE